MVGAEEENGGEGDADTVEAGVRGVENVMGFGVSSRARIGLRSGERVGISTVSTTVASSFNGNARSSSQVKVLARHQAGPLVVAFTMSFGRSRPSSDLAARGLGGASYWAIGLDATRRLDMAYQSPVRGTYTSYGALQE